MSRQSYNKPIKAANGRKSSAPTLQELLYSSIDEFETMLMQRPYFQDGLTRIMSNMIAHECRKIGF